MRINGDLLYLSRPCETMSDSHSGRIQAAGLDERRASLFGRRWSLLTGIPAELRIAGGASSLLGSQDLNDCLESEIEVMELEREHWFVQL